jgi:DNA-binding NarL/FixJ family response regulator
MLTVFDNEEHIFNAIKAGATGYLMKEEKLGRIQQAFDEVMEGGSSMSAMIAQKTMQMMLNGFKGTATEIHREQEDKLTKREFEILEHLSKGLKSQELADKLFISPATVKKHIENIYNKLQLHSRVELVNWFHQH